MPPQRPPSFFPSAINQGDGFFGFIGVIEQYVFRELSRVIKVDGDIMLSGRASLSWRVARFGFLNANTVTGVFYHIT